MGIILYTLLCPFYGVHTERFTKFKYDIINQIIDNGTLPNEIIIDTSGPIVPGGGGGGVSIGDPYFPKDRLVPEVQIGGSYSDRNKDTVIIPGPNTEERTLGGETNLPPGIGTDTED